MTETQEGVVSGHNGENVGPGRDVASRTERRGRHVWSKPGERCGCRCERRSVQRRWEEGRGSRVRQGAWRWFGGQGGGGPGKEKFGQKGSGPWDRKSEEKVPGHEGQAGGDEEDPLIEAQRTVTLSKATPAGKV